MGLVTGAEVAIAGSGPLPGYSGPPPPPAVPGHDRAIGRTSPSGPSCWAAGVGPMPQTMPEPLAHAQVGHRPHVEPAQLEQQEHLGGPGADAADTGELGHHGFVGLPPDGGQVHVTVEDLSEHRSRSEASLFPDSPAGSCGSASLGPGEPLRAEHTARHDGDPSENGSAAAPASCWNTMPYQGANGPGASRRVPRSLPDEAGQDGIAPGHLLDRRSERDSRHRHRDLSGRQI